MHAYQAAQKLWLQREPALYFFNRLNQIVKRPQTRFSGGSAASRRAPTVLTSFPVLARVIYALNALTCSAGRGSVLSGIHSPGQTSLVSLNARAVVSCWAWRVGVAVWQKKKRFVSPPQPGTVTVVHGLQRWLSYWLRCCMFQPGALQES